MVLVYSDNKNIAFELLAKASEIAKELGKKVNAVAINDETIAKEYGKKNIKSN